MTSINYSPIVLIVDDQHQNLQLVGSTLKHINCRMMFATNGEEALHTIKSHTPDLILLDIMMPEVDGFRVCEVLKANRETADIPIIFLTAKVEGDDIARGFATGAADYITKPFVREELIARVELQLQLARANHNLVEAIDLLSDKNTQLQNANQLKDAYIAMVAHDLKNPMAAIIGRCEYLLHITNQEKFLKRANESLNAIHSSSEKMLHEIQHVLEKQNFDHTASSQPQKFDIVEAIDEIVHINRVNAERKNIQLNLEFPTSIATSHSVQLSNRNTNNTPIERTNSIYSNPGSIKEIADNLISNAVKYSPAHSTVLIRLEPINARPRFWQLVITDQGPGFSTEDQKNMFQRFHRLSAQPTAGESSSGLGLYITKDLLHAINGEISLDLEYTEGARFVVRLPDLEKAPH